MTKEEKNLEYCLGCGCQAKMQRHLLRVDGQDGGDDGG